ncbi:hypothetical protein [Pseudonocardia lacus]|uniref:hypothetical protein n=1 Tax=Pseudonocardia lacus TaxID=2835865 RepID=UPI001BDD8C0C|nr:hypothetical protein [Pseudonocardia lacus]
MDVVVWVVVGAGFAAMALVLATGSSRMAVAVGLPRSTGVAMGAALTAVWLAWVVVSGLLAAAGAYRQDPSAPRPWFAVTFVGVLAAVLLVARVPVVARALAGPHVPAMLVAAQAPRVVGGVFLLVMAAGGLPPVFALPAGIGDVAVGVAAVFVARRMRAGTAGRGPVWFTVLGMLDLVIALTVGTAAGLLGVQPTMAAIGVPPLALIPTAAVPLAFGLHVLALQRLRAGAPGSGGQPLNASGAGPSTGTS